MQQPGKLVHRERSVPVVVRRGELRLEVLLVLLLNLDTLGSVQDRAESANPTKIATQKVANVDFFKKNLTVPHHPAIWKRS